MVLRTTSESLSAERRTGVPRQRCCPAADTVERLRPHFATMGITRLSDITGLDRIGIPVAQAVRPMGRSLSVSQGKGLDLDAALASAAMEAAETWHAEFAEVEQVWASAEDLQQAGHAVVRPSDLVPGRDGEKVAEDGRAATAMTWTSGTDLLTGVRTFVPFDVVDMDFTRQPDTGFLPRSSNGLAGGNTLEEATVSAIHELAERDCVADFAGLEFIEQGQRRVDSTTLADRWPDVRWLLGRLKRASVEVELFDLTNDLGIPAMQARIYECGNRTAFSVDGVFGPSLGSGANTDPEIAALRAITEAAQSRLTRINGARDDLDPGRYRPDRAGNLGQRLSMIADLIECGFCRYDYPVPDQLTAPAILESLLTALRLSGLRQVVRINLTRADMDIPVVRMVIPGLGRRYRGAQAHGARPRRRRVV